MKILLIHCHYRLPGGEDAVFAAERALLEQRGHQVAVYERSNEEAAHGLAKLLLPLQAVWNFSAARQVRDLIARESPDAVHRITENLGCSVGKRQQTVQIDGSLRLPGQGLHLFTQMLHLRRRHKPQVAAFRLCLPANVLPVLSISRGRFPALKQLLSFPFSLLC